MLKEKLYFLIKLYVLILINLLLVICKFENISSIVLCAFFVVIALFYTLGIIYGDSNSLVKKSDSSSIFLTIMILWQFFTCYIVIGDPIFYPSPEKVLMLTLREFPRFCINFLHSMQLLIIGFALAFIFAFPLGLLLGSNTRLRLALDPYIKILSPISPIAYVPYIIGIMPTFRSASIFVIFAAIFWPILKWTIHGMMNLDANYLLTAKLLRLNRFTLYKKVIIPSILPHLLSGISQSISGGFAVLVAAEMIGSRNGLGFYIKYFADFLNYHKVIVGILYLGISICTITWLLDKLSKKLLSWQHLEHK